jgi:hypothetical protein
MLQYRTPDMVPKIKIERTEYLGHVIGMDVVEVSKKYFERLPESVRKMKIPKLRWLEDERSGKLCSGGKITTIFKNMHPS